MLLELFLVILALLWILHIKRTKKYPLGPFSIPLIGTIDMFQRSKSPNEILFSEKYFTYEKFCTFYVGPIVSVLINDFKIAKELFSRDEFSGNMRNDQVSLQTYKSNQTIHQ